MGKSDGFSRFGPSALFLAALLLSLGGLAVAVRDLPAGISYAIWTAIGASLTVSYGMVTGAEPASLIKVLLIFGVIGCVVGLKLVTN